METLQRLHNRGSISTGEYEIDNSLKLESDNSETVYRENSNGNRRTWTSSLWFKRTELTGSTTQHILTHGVFTNGLRVFFLNENLYMDIADATSTYYRFISNQLFRDTSAWYHMVWRVDTTSSTATERARIYINGEEITWGTEPTVPQNYDTLANFSNAQIDEMQFSYRQASSYQNSYIAEFHHVDGQSLAPTEFGEVDSDTGIWKPIEYTGTYGTNGCYLDFSNSSSLGADSSGNGNNFTLSNITSVDQALDTPTNNFCIVNAHSSFLLRDATGINLGATRINHTNENQWCAAITTMGVTKGKWYWEVVINDFDDQMVGVTTFTGNTGSNTNPYQINHTWNIYGGGSSGSYWISHINGTTTGNSSNRGAVWSAGSYIGVALDMDNSTLSFYHNGTLDSPNNSSIDISSLTALGHPLIPYVNVWRNAMWLNFGGYWSYPTAIASGNTDDNGYGNFEYAPPSGYYALCSKNLAEYG